jgi:hypothetical protein
MTMPNFLIIGSGKGGTSALYRYLKQHPQIYMSPVKEPRFFAFEGATLDFVGPGDKKTINRTTITSLEAYRSLFEEVKNEKAIGEASPLYLYMPKAPERIQHYIPNAKLIAILRNPVDRAYSHFLHLIRDGHEPLTDFSQALREEKTRIQKNWAPHWYYQERGFYYVQLKRYFDLFEQHQLKVYLYEDLRDNPIGLIENIFQFLEVDDTFVPDISVKYNVSGIPQNKGLHSLYKFLKNPSMVKSMFRPFLPKKLRQQLHQNILNNPQNWNLIKPKLSPEVRSELMEVYREDILNLQKLIQRDLSAWLET